MKTASFLSATLLMFAAASAPSQPSPVDPNPGEAVPGPGQIAEPVAEPLPQKILHTTLACLIKPSVLKSAIPSPEDFLPKAQAPLKFNRHFKQPNLVWDTPEGFFGAFDAGEWGGGLFHLENGKDSWERLIDRHIQQLFDFGGETWLAVGRLEHLNGNGSAHLLTRSKDGSWKARQVFDSRCGAAFVLGLADPDGLRITEILAVVGVNAPDEPAQAFGISRAGVVHYLGRILEEGGTQVAGPAAEPPADQPAPPARPPGADPDADAPKADLVLKLRDGSTFKGGVDVENTLRFRARFGDVSVPYPQLQKIAFGAEPKNTQLHFRNGDRLTGEVLSTTVVLKGPNGESETEMKEIESIEVQPAHSKPR